MELWMSIITASAGFIGALIGGIITSHSAKKQIQVESDRINSEKREAEQLNVKVVKTFLMNEIKYNIAVLQELEDAFKHEFDYYKRNSYIFDKDFKFEEYNRVKYELIQHPSLTINTTVEIYQAFYLLNRKRDFNLYTENEYDFVKRIYRNSLIMNFDFDIPKFVGL
ncbi:hypothetical protein [Virgibacillus necropolis]|uniref:Uncharacterized protein n=1 Tax=Virgibacillus necropolis TaxID=163877 RepID=A0A221MD40_9BACI|nr:hypothetical protein [Virgibacillus necropolis]ASN05551.1 hypothetical protein CFK40_11285 [Virgibacillus necropolis]